MATIVKRGDGRYEIRESVRTPKGPRSRTLAVFRVLSDDVVDAAAARSQHDLDRDQLIERARALGVPRRVSQATATAKQLIGRLRRDEHIDPVIAAALARELDGYRRESPDGIEGVLDWMGTTVEQRGRALRDLLVLSDRVQRSKGRPARTGHLRYPRLRSR